MKCLMSLLPVVLRSRALLQLLRILLPGNYFEIIFNHISRLKLTSSLLASVVVVDGFWKAFLFAGLLLSKLLRFVES